MIEQFGPFGTPFQDNHRFRNVVLLFQILAILFLIATILVWQIRGAGRVSIATLLIATFASVCACIFSFLKPTENETTATESAFVLLLVSLALLVPLISGFNEVCGFFQSKEYGRILLPELYCCLALVAVTSSIHLIAQLVKNAGYYRDAFMGIRKRQILYYGIYVLVVGAIVCVGVHFIGHWVRWDNATYYFSVDKLSIVNLFQSGRDGLVSGGHPESAYVLLVFDIKAILNVSTLSAMYISNIVVTVFSFALAVKLLKEMIPSEYDLLYLFAGGIFICGPYVLGGMDKLNPEYLCLMSMLLYFVGVARDNTVLCLLGCFGVCNTRENAAIAIAAVILAQYVIEVAVNWQAAGASFRTKAKPSRVFKAMEGANYIRYAALLLIGVLWLFVYMGIDWVDHMQQSSSHEYYYIDGTPFFNVAISPIFIGNQVKTMVLTNFTWLYVVIIVACLIFERLTRKEKSKTDYRWQSQTFWLLVIGCISSICVLCVFVTYHNFRYYTLPVSLISLICLCCVIRIVIKHIDKLRQCMLCIALMGTLLLFQCFGTIDPVMLAVFPSFSTGNTRLVSPSWYISGYPSNNQLLQSARYNYQVSFLDDALDLAYSKMVLNDASILFYDGYTWGDRSSSFNTIYGFGYSNFGRYSSWNGETKSRELNGSEDANVDPVAVSNISQIEQCVKEHSHVYYIGLPWGDALVQEFDSADNLSVEHIDTIEYGGWVLQLYEFQPRPDLTEVRA